MEDHHVQKLKDAIVDDDAPKPSLFHEQSIPKEAENPQLVDSMIAAEMSKLSVEEREKAYLDIHGVLQHIDESPAMIEKGLADMEAELKQLPNRKAYEKAMSMDEDYVSNAEFRLRFLRTDLFDAHKAAIRFLKHFQIKMDLFGVDKLVLDITQDDLQSDVMDVLYSGYGRFLPQRDRAGRPINVMIPHPDHQTEAMMRRAFYALSVQFEDAEANRRGLVSVLYFLGHTANSLTSDVAWKVPKVNEGLPMRVAAIHICYDTGQWTPIHSIIKLALHTFAKVRVRTHYGSHAECLSHLQSHGIDPATIPISLDGKPADMDAFHYSLRQQRKRERLQKPQRSKIYVPSQFDVLLGKGSSTQSFIGNKRLRSIAMDCQKQYDKAPRGTKNALVQELVDTVLQASGMFLRKDGDAWVAVDNATAHQKVAALFRTNRMQQRRETTKGC